ncbi:uncharacterized protein DUF1801 [Roseivirga ehrenbergii]|uniref:YdhG-like domain-containing protein n=1 Tax=Roseivirga ehrenbergii (strain DSM 102268 / JCM 13514 / KCTC 12282 / NCIMB 14502 / KMM 6017) TaxID=279360 RepID=A0A150WYV4_ROSEK|nr:DUF1801 domain-containing protein [Roseivirga ehrenbergii]KYG71668.1 hypothetical protein MB14_10135 [Roseivirga ehrenbergii]TCL07642.1 uncharacterized protein DUF1801 [Roseivirga ehrenbergii]
MTKAQNKTTETNASVSDFLNSIAEEKKKNDCVLIKNLMEEITGEAPKMWGPSIVGFGTYHYKYDSGREGDFLKIGFSPRVQNLTLYIMPGFEKYEDYMARLGKYKTGKSCLYIKKIEDVDIEILKLLITDSYEYMTNKYG